MKKIIVFGAGKKGKYYIDRILKEAINIRIVAILDNDRRKQGKKYRGINILSPNEINSLNYDKILYGGEYHIEIEIELLEKWNVSPDKMSSYNNLEKDLLLDYYESNVSLIESDMLEVLAYIKKHKLNVYNYPFIEKYEKMKVTPFYDEKCKLFYVVHKGKKMYMSRLYDTKEKVVSYYKFIRMEQDRKSPHKYLDDSFTVCRDSVILDAGVAEGNFSLEIIDIARFVYLVEVDEGWAEALRYTFEPYSNKVKIINKFLTDNCEDNNITIDSIAQEMHIDFIKMDIEGAEVTALKGAGKLLRENSRIKVCACAYHNYDDEKLIDNVLKDYGFMTYTSQGYMVFLASETRPYRLVKGLIRAEK